MARYRPLIIVAGISVLSGFVAAHLFGGSNRSLLPLHTDISRPEESRPAAPDPTSAESKRFRSQIARDDLTVDELVALLKFAKSNGRPEDVAKILAKLLTAAGNDPEKLVAFLDAEPTLRYEIAGILRQLKSPATVLPLLRLLKKANPIRQRSADQALVLLLQGLAGDLAPVVRPEQFPQLEEILFADPRDGGVYQRLIAFRLLFFAAFSDPQALLARVFQDPSMFELNPEPGAQTEFDRSAVKTFYEGIVRMAFDRLGLRAGPELVNAYSLVPYGNELLGSGAKGAIANGIAKSFSPAEAVPILMSLASQYARETWEGFCISQALASELKEPGILFDLASRLAQERNPISQLTLILTLNRSQDERVSDALLRYLENEGRPETALARENAVLGLSLVTSPDPARVYATVMPVVRAITDEPSRYRDSMRATCAVTIGHLWETNPGAADQFTALIDTLYRQTNSEGARIEMVDVLKRNGGASSIQYLQGMRLEAVRSESPNLQLSIDTAISVIQGRVR